MDKLWYIKIDDREEGPYSFEDLKNDFRLTPDTLCRREGQTDWIPIRDVEELRELFKDEDRASKGEDKATLPPREEIALTIYKDPMINLYRILIVIVLLLYLLYKIFL